MGRKTRSIIWKRWWIMFCCSIGPPWMTRINASNIHKPWRLQPIVVYPGFGTPVSRPEVWFLRCHLLLLSSWYYQGGVTWICGSGPRRCSPGRILYWWTCRSMVHCPCTPLEGRGGNQRAGSLRGIYLGRERPLTGRHQGASIAACRNCRGLLF